MQGKVFVYDISLLCLKLVKDKLMGIYFKAKSNVNINNYKNEILLT